LLSRREQDSNGTPGTRPIGILIATVPPVNVSSDSVHFLEQEYRSLDQTVVRARSNRADVDPVETLVG
jgi:hypothetical protein